MKIETPPEPYKKRNPTPNRMKNRSRPERFVQPETFKYEVTETQVRSKRVQYKGIIICSMRIRNSNQGRVDFIKLAYFGRHYD